MEVIGGIGILTLAYFMIKYKGELGQAKNDIFNLANKINNFEANPQSEDLVLKGAVESIQTKNYSPSTW